MTSNVKLGTLVDSGRRLKVGAVVKYCDGRARVNRIGEVGGVAAVWLDGVDGYHQPKHLEVL